MHEALEEAARELALDLSTLRENAAYSDGVIHDAREAMRELAPEIGAENMDVMVFGSLARREARPGSDFDFLIIAHGLPHRADMSRDFIGFVDQIRERLNFERPGPTGTFGTVVAAPELTEKIGLEQDTNATHTRRILTLEESESIYRPELRDVLVNCILERYLDGVRADKHVPRFLLNDIIKYWRTIAVDYQAKVWEGRTKWGLRYLKLIIARKLTFAGTIASIFTAGIGVAELGQHLSVPPLARLARLMPLLTPQHQSDLGRILVVAETFAMRMRDSEWVKRAAQVDGPGDVDGTVVEEMQREARDLQDCLEGIFFEDPEMKDKAVRYLSF